MSLQKKTIKFYHQKATYHGIAMFSRRSRNSIEQELQSVVPIPDPPASVQFQVDRAGTDINLENEAITEQQLERADGGVVAWRNLLAAFMFEALLWGERCAYMFLHRFH